LKERIRISAALAITACGLLFVPTSASASATTGSIEGVTVGSSLTYASVQNISATYDQCSSEQPAEPSCSWTAMAMLVPPAWSECSSNGIYGLPPGMPPISPIKVWSDSSMADGTIQSGPLTFPLRGVNDEHLCLYVNRNSAWPSSSASSLTPAQSSTPLLPNSELVASQLLHVDPLPPVTAPTPPGPPSAATACKKHQVRRKGKCVRAKHRRHHRRSSHQDKAAPR
jgi:hypothetical protein